MDALSNPLFQTNLIPTTVAGGGRERYDFCRRWGFDEAHGLPLVLNRHAEPRFRVRFPVLREEFRRISRGVPRSGIANIYSISLARPVYHPGIAAYRSTPQSAILRST